MLSLIFLSQSVLTVYFIGVQLSTVILFGLFIFILVFILCLKKYRTNKYIVLSVFIYLTCIITYYASLTGIESGCYIYYFSVLTAIPIFYSIKKDAGFVSFIFLFVLGCFYFSAYNNFQLWGEEAQLPYKEFQHDFLLLNISCKLSLLGINYFFMDQKRNDYYHSLTKNIVKREQIETLSHEIKQLRRLVDKKQLSEENIVELLSAINLNDTLFLDQFEKYFPLFSKNILKDTGVVLSTAELILCAELKLGLSTKEIALYSNASLKAVEGRKYRLRKKLNIPSEVDLVIWCSKY